MKKIFLLGAATVVILSSCNFMGKRVRGNGNIVRSNVSVSDFNSISQTGSVDVVVRTGDARDVKIEADENIVPYIETKVEGETLVIRTRPGFWLKSTRDIKVYVTAPILTSIKSSGSGDIMTESTLMSNEPISFSTSGSADINVDVHAPSVKASITGSGNIDLRGETKSLDAEVMGSGDIKAADLKTEETKVDIAGSGNANVYASVKLDVSVKGSGDVRYSGNPPSVVSSMHGSGSLEKQ